MSTSQPPKPANISRRSVSVSSGSSAPTSRATSRVASSLRPSSSVHPVTHRRPSPKAPLPSATNDETNESLSASLKHETEQKEQLLLQIQDKEQTISSLVSDNGNLTSALHEAESRLTDLYAEQTRSEMELAQRMDIAEKLRTQVRELEKEKRDLQRRYNEQTATFEAERQAFYDNEQHLKSRIQSLSQARKTFDAPPAASEPETDLESEHEDEYSVEYDTPAQKPDLHDPEVEPAEMTALKLELSTLSTSYSSLQSTLVLLQTQLVDLKRVNYELQEENESYMILLREKTLNGQFDLMRQVGGGSTTSDDDGEDQDQESGSLHSITRSLNRVDEEPGESLAFLEDSDHPDHAETDLGLTHSSRHPSRQGRRRTTSNAAPRGESLADLPITGPGLDLAAELGRAENKDILAGNSVDDNLTTSKKRSKRADARKVSSSETGAPEHPSGDIDALRTEVKSLKDANKALSLYASKIIDRIIAQEGFEHVLAVDYEKEPTTPIAANAKATKMPIASQTKPRPQSLLVSNPTSAPASETPNTAVPPRSAHAASKAQRRSLSFDWKGFSLFSGSEKKPEPNLRPLTLRPGGNAVTGARKLDTQEDDEDRKERERLNATMKLMGIQPSSDATSSPIPALEPSGPAPSPNPRSSNRRFSLFGSRTRTVDDSSTPSTPSLNEAPGLTQEALEHAEVENTLAALDSHERNLSAEIAKGNGSGFTEIAPRASRKGRRSAGGSGSGSTVWSAGLSEDH